MVLVGRPAGRVGRREPVFAVCCLRAHMVRAQCLEQTPKPSLQSAHGRGYVLPLPPRHLQAPSYEARLDGTPPCPHRGGSLRCPDGADTVAVVDSGTAPAQAHSRIYELTHQKQRQKTYGGSSAWQSSGLQNRRSKVQILPAIHETRDKVAARERRQTPERRLKAAERQIGAAHNPHGRITPEKIRTERAHHKTQESPA